MEPAEKKQEITSQALFHRDLLINFTKFVILALIKAENEFVFYQNRASDAFIFNISIIVFDFIVNYSFRASLIFQVFLQVSALPLSTV